MYSLSFFYILSRPKEKPIVRCVAPVNLKDRSDDAAATLRQLQPQELLELLEGGTRSPRGFKQETWGFPQGKWGNVI